jgi:dienelactone hydrolase
MSGRFPGEEIMRPQGFSRRLFLAGAMSGLTWRWSRAADEPPGLTEVPWLAEVQQPPTQLPADRSSLKSLLVRDDGTPITTRDQWPPRREALRRWWLDFLGDLRISRDRPPALKVVAEDRPDGVVRQLVEYEVEPGVSVEAYLLKPAEIRQQCPGVVVLHSTVTHTIRQPAGLEGPPEKAFGLKFARRGFVALCPRCFLWSKDLSIPYQEHVRQFQARHPGCRGMAKMLHDSQVAVDILAAQPEVDPQRLGAVGHSLGAKEVLYLAAFDERIRAAVSSEGGIGTRFSNWEASWYLGEAIRQPALDHEHHELLALVAPRAFLLIGGESADGDRSWAFVQAALPVYRLLDSPPRLGFFNHRGGHAVPPESERRIAEWLVTYTAQQKRS